ncbi:MAG: division/cell wall cluster transcriptional repressor MraZ, partial [Alicyclobacillus sp.]|nr:division/cell wall cluster transcriptional repressor MraZ [Alicyclobacillus sp.]
ITRGLDKCLFAYPQSEWEKLENKLQGLPLARADARAFVRFLFSGATECVPDKQGRVLLPSSLREYADMERDVVVVGVSNRVELWSLPRWQAYTAEAASSFADIAEKLVDLPL